MDLTADMALPTWDGTWVELVYDTGCQQRPGLGLQTLLLDC